MQIITEGAQISENNHKTDDNEKYRSYRKLSFSSQDAIIGANIVLWEKLTWTSRLIGGPPTIFQNSAVSWPCGRTVMSALLFRSFLLIFSAISLLVRKMDKCLNYSSTRVSSANKHAMGPFLSIMLWKSTLILPEDLLWVKYFHLISSITPKCCECPSIHVVDWLTTKVIG